jgi:Rieske Fe-S protein
MTCWRRRDVLRALGLATISCAGKKSPPPCVVPDDAGTAGGTSYCLVTGEVIRVPGARLIDVGQAALFNVDDDTAVVIARDVDGAYAMSAICTHQCCLLALCENSACTSLGTNPGECMPTAIGTPAATGAALICACHGSSFAIDGTVLTKPATRALPHYALAFEGDDALVDVSQIVSMSTRL